MERNSRRRPPGHARSTPESRPRPAAVAARMFHGVASRLEIDDHGDWNWRRLCRNRRTQVLTEPCNFAEKGCNLADIAFLASPPPAGTAGRSAADGLTMFQFEGYTLDIARHSLRAGDREIALRPKSFEVLRYLVENADRVVTKEELIKAIWPKVIVTDDALTHCVSEVRQAIGDSRQTIIVTVPRRGYRFTASVLRLTTNAAVAPQPTPPSQRRRQPGPMRGVRSQFA